MDKFEFDVSVIVLTYNPNYEKLFNTLKSVIHQKECNFEVIISDDGSAQFNKQLIAKWMEDKGVKNYTILVNEINRGTVMNTYESVKLARGKYIKLISPGDYLYCDNVLKNITDYMKKNKYSISFGRAVYYFINNSSEMVVLNKTNPMDLNPYIKKNYNKIKKNYLYYQDYILGSSVVCETDLFYKYILKIKDNVKYLEDLSYLMMIADGININFWNNYLIWYECNTGISTSGSAEWGKKMDLDNSECFKLVAKEHPNYNNICKLHFIENINQNFIFRLKRKCRRILLRIKNRNMNQDFDINQFNKIIEG